MKNEQIIRVKVLQYAKNQIGDFITDVEHIGTKGGADYYAPVFAENICCGISEPFYISWNGSECKITPYEEFRE